jgi:dinuclear metal center YbgI/SA1388 family protein
MLITDIIRYLEELAPPALQESYDNSGLLTGNHEWPVKNILVCLDVTEEILDEALQKNCNLIVAHHPVIFSGLKRLTGRDYVERVVIKALKNDLAIYAIHTNLDNVQAGVNTRIAERLGLNETRILSPGKNQLLKLVTYVPENAAEEVRSGLFSAGAGHIGNYDECSFNIEGTGTFRPVAGAEPVQGEIGKRFSGREIRLEVILPVWKESEVLKALRKKHPYEEIAYELFRIENKLQTTGSGMIGKLPEAMVPLEFIDYLKEKMKTPVVRHTRLKGAIRTVAVCGGAGSFLLQEAIRQGADAFVSSDFKYHQFFEADDKIIVADIGHFESEQFTMDLLVEYLRKKFTKFAVHLTETNTNPIHYR